ncbi:dienelactone hydrolase family protein [Kitasatospora sp. NPDC094016]|uniref:dienelactone hydrolase family protein n=1 Tax=Kitasatospora sp. NPDC094016 TaxID=3154986 RepID=UPI00331BE00F
MPFPGVLAHRRGSLVPRTGRPSERPRRPNDHRNALTKRQTPHHITQTDGASAHTPAPPRLTSPGHAPHHGRVATFDSWLTTKPRSGHWTARNCSARSPLPNSPSGTRHSHSRCRHHPRRGRLHLDPERLCADAQSPVLIVHGTKDTFVDVELSRRFAPLFGAGAELYELDGAQHGFAVHDDPTYAHPQSQAWQREVVAKVADFLSL